MMVENVILICGPYYQSDIIANFRLCNSALQTELLRHAHNYLRIKLFCLISGISEHTIKYIKITCI
jgi:hypothetical protein